MYLSIYIYIYILKYSAGRVQNIMNGACVDTETLHSGYTPAVSVISKWRLYIIHVYIYTRVVIVEK